MPQQSKGIALAVVAFAGVIGLAIYGGRIVLLAGGAHELPYPAVRDTFPDPTVFPTVVGKATPGLDLQKMFAPTPAALAQARIVARMRARGHSLAHVRNAAIEGKLAYGYLEDLFGDQGHPIRCTVTEMGPLLLGRLLELNDTQEGVLNIAFRVADENQWPVIDLKDLRSLADEGKKQVGSGVVAIVGLTDDGKAGIVVGVTPDLTGRFNAVDLVRKGAEALGGKGGGGRPDMAQAGGPDGSKADAALSAIEAALGGH